MLHMPSIVHIPCGEETKWSILTVLWTRRLDTKQPSLGLSGEEYGLLVVFVGTLP